MLGWKIFVRAVTLLTDNLPAALRVSALPFAPLIAMDIWIATTWPTEIGATYAQGTPVPTDFAFAVLLRLLVALAVMLWVAVGWHRYILRGEIGEGWLPPLNRPHFMAYLGRSIGVGLVVAAVALLVGIFTAPLAMVIGVGPVSTLMPLLGGFLGMLATYRLAPLLPAAALGEAMDYGEAWRRTDGHTATAAVLAVLTLALVLGLQVPQTLDGGGGGLIGGLYTGVSQWILVMVGSGILSALYGHLIEGRPLD